MPRRPPSRLAFVAATAAPLAHAAALAPPTSPLTSPPAWVIIDRDLNPLPAAAILTLDEGTLAYTDTQERPATLPLSRALAIVPADWYARRASPAWSMLPLTPRRPARGVSGLLELSDGTRIVGSLVPSDTGGERLAWRHPVLPQVVVPLDALRRVVLRPVPRPGAEGAAPAGAETADRAELVNGDAVRGLITNFAPPPSQASEASVTIESLPAPGQPRAPARTIDFDRIATLVLANPPAAPPPARVWLLEGSVLGSGDLSIDGAQVVHLTMPGLPPAAPAAFPFVHVRALAVGAAGLRALADVPLAPGADLRIDRDDAQPDPLGAADITLPRPLTAVWTVPPGARRLSGLLVLPESSRPWGDCVVTIASAGTTVLTQRLSAATPEVDFNVAVKPGELRVTLQEGERGPVQDAVLIRRALVAGD